MERFESSLYAMGSTFSLILYGDDPKRLEEAATAAFEEILRLDAMLSNYRPESEWSRMNLSAGQRPFELSTELFEFLERCQAYSRQSDGAFDISVGPLTRVWGFHGGTGRLPSSEEIEAARAAVGYRKMRLDPADQSVFFEHPAMEVDPGGIGKGYAVDCAVRIIKELGINTAMIVGSASSIYGLGSPPCESRGWVVDICSPKNPRKVLDQVFLKDMSVSTSGIGEKSFWAEGRFYSHIIDPRTGYPAQEMAQVSVIAPSAADSEAWTKPCFIDGPHSTTNGYQAKCMNSQIW